MRLVVRGGHPLRGVAAVPGDKSIGHRAVLLAGIADGASSVRGLSGGEDVGRTIEAMRALGVRIEAPGAGAIDVAGGGLEGLRAPVAAIDCGNSGTTMRLLAGLLAARAFPVTLVGDASLSRRPMGRVAEPLRAMGGAVEGTPAGPGPGIVPPLRMGGAAARPRGIAWRTRVASAQVKSAVLLCALRAESPTRVDEPSPTRDHTERMLAAMGAPVGFGPGWAELDPRGWDGRLAPLALEVPGDLSAALFPLAAALLAPGSEVEARGVTVQPARAGALEALAEMGASLGPERTRTAGGEPVGDLVARTAERLSGGRLAGARAAAAIDEVPVLAAVAALARGDTVIADAAELRVKESDRIATTVAMLAAFGVRAEERRDGLVVHGLGGRELLRAARVDAAGDHRIAMAAAALALAVPAGAGETVIDGAGGVPTSFPGFASAMRALGGDVREEGGD